jgi:AGCS family alanine or glycine:cation symporter
MINEILNFFVQCNDTLHNIIFFDIIPGPITIPFLVLNIFIASIYFLVKTKFIPVTHFIDIFRYGKIDNDNSINGITSKKALASGISGSVGLGSLAGVAIAISVGGPGAVFWIFVTGFLSMPFRFAEVYLAHYYRVIDKNGNVTLSGPFAYMTRGFLKLGFAKFGMISATIFGFLFIIATFGGTNAFQSNQSVVAISSAFFNNQHKLIISAILAIIVCLVIIGGLKTIANVAEFLVSIMSIVYVFAALTLLYYVRHDIWASIQTITSSALNIKAFGASLIPAFVSGVSRSVFADEVGQGSVPTFHSHTTNRCSFDEGVKSMAGPFFCSMIICSINGLIIVATKTFMLAGVDGIEMMRHSFLIAGNLFAQVLPIIVFLFGYSTIVAWFYYGEKAMEFVMRNNKNHKKYLMTYKILYCACVFFSGMISLDNVVKFADSLTLGITIPNTIIIVILFTFVKVQRRSGM